MKLLRALVLSFAACMAAPIGCVGDDASSSSEDLTQEIAFEELDIVKEHAPAGLTVLKSKTAYTNFFGQAPSSEVDFTRHWVVHLSQGMKNSGGYSINVVKIEKSGSGNQRTLEVYGHASSPGPHCLVTQAITNPQMTVRIKKQPGTPNSRLQLESEVADCGQYGACGDLGGECLSSPSDVTFPADCKQDYAMDTAPDAECGAINQVCCIPIQCAGFAGLQCPDDAVCVDVPDDGCDPQNGGADCGGICQKKVACGGFAGITCQDGMTCVDDPDDSCDPANGGADCMGMCQPRSPASGSCVKNSNDECTKDSDCINGGCGGELCFNPDLSSGISTCECTEPTAVAGCGCVENKCTWYN